MPITDPGVRGRAAARAALLASGAIPATASGVARLYSDLCRRYVLDVADADEANTVTALGLRPVVVPTLVHRGARARALAEAVLGNSDADGA